MNFQNMPEFLSYQNFNIEVAADQHTVCRVSFTISLDKAEDFLSAAEQRLAVEITSDNGDKVMTGKVFSVTVDFGASSAIAEVVIISESIEYQERGKERIFQDPDKTVKDILSSFPDVIIGKFDSVSDKIESVIFQHDMDDFSFLVYLAGISGTRLWITEEGKIIFGTLDMRTAFSDQKKNRSAAILGKQLSSQKSGNAVQIETLHQLPSGSVISYNNTEYTVCNVRVFERYGETRFLCKGYTDPRRTLETKPPLIVARAKVTDQNDPDNLGRIQVGFIDFEDNAEKKVWIPCLTPFVGKNNGGLVMIPDVGDEVIVMISEGKPFIMNTIRTEVLPENCREIANKHFAVKDSVITFTEETITVVNGKSAVIICADSISASSDKSFVKIEPESISSESGRSSLTLKNDLLQAENGKSVLQLKNGSSEIEGGKSSLSLNNGNTEISGNKIDLSTQGFSI